MTSSSVVPAEDIPEQVTDSNKKATRKTFNFISALLWLGTHGE
jgi:hypothetical protein